MAIRFDAAADRIARTSGLLDYNGTYTWMGWYRIVTDTNDYTAFFSSHRNDSSVFFNEDWLGTQANGTQLMLWCSNNTGGAEANGSNLSVDTWYHLAIVRSSTTLLTAYLNGVSNITNTTNVAGRAAALRMDVGGQYAANLNRFDGRTTCHKIWTAALTAAEIAAEMNTVRPQRFADLWLWTPLLGSGDLVDYSGNARDWTAGGTLTTEDGPPVSWGSPIWVVPYAAATGTVYTSSPAGALTPTGAIAKRANKTPAGSVGLAGAISRATSHIVAGAVGLAGAVNRVTSRTVAGAVGLAGALGTQLIQLFEESVGGVLGLAGAISKQTNKTPAGSVGLAGAISRATSHIVAGVLGLAGAVNRVTSRTVAGAVGLAGAVGTQLIGLYTQAVGGVLGLAGAVNRVTSRTVAGAVGLAGSISRSISRTIAGVLGLAGATLRQLFGPSAPKLDVTMSDAAVTALTMADSALTTLTIGDSALTTLTIGEATV